MAIVYKAAAEYYFFGSIGQPESGAISGPYSLNRDCLNTLLKSYGRCGDINNIINNME